MRRSYWDHLQHRFSQAYILLKPDTPENVEEQLVPTQHHRIQNNRYLTLLFVLSILLNAWLLHKFSAPGLFCSRYTTEYGMEQDQHSGHYRKLIQIQSDSPVTLEQSITYETISFNGSFLNQSSYRQNAGPDTDAAWTALGTDCKLDTHFLSTISDKLDSPIVILETDAPRYGLDKGQVKFAAEQGGGFVANIEVFHHLHCLVCIFRF
jgi:hypothetical protein